MAWVIASVPAPWLMGMSALASVQAQAEIATSARPAPTITRSRRSTASITTASPVHVPVPASSAVGERQAALRQLTWPGTWTQERAKTPDRDTRYPLIERHFRHSSSVRLLDGRGCFRLRVQHRATCLSQFVDHRQDAPE